MRQVLNFSHFVTCPDNPSALEMKKGAKFALYVQKWGMA